MRKLKLFFACLLMAVLSIGQVWATPLTATFNWASGGNMTTATGTQGQITLTGAANDASGAPAVTDNTLRLYAKRTNGNGSSATFTADEGYQILSFTVNVSQNGSVMKYAIDGGTTYTAFSYSNNSATISDLTASSFTLKNCQSSGSSNNTIRLVSVVISYESTSSCSNTVAITKGAETNGNYSLSATEICGDGDGGTIEISDITPATGYVFDEITTSASGTVDNDLKKVTGITAATTITVKFKELPKYKVSFNVGGSSASQADITETTAGAGITLPAGPTPTCSADGWVFAGWAEAAVASETTTAPTLLAVGANYKPSDDVTLYAVYKKTVTSGSPETKYVQVTGLAQINAGGEFIITNGTKYLPSTTTSSSVAQANMVAITDGVVTGTVVDVMKWTISAADGDGYVTVTNADSKYLYATNSNSGLRVGTTEDTWKFEEYTVSAVLGFAMQEKNNSRWCAVYTDGSDWRPYGSKDHTNYKTNSGRLDIYKATEITPSTTYYLSAPSCSCEPLDAPSVTVTNKTYNGAKLTWAAVANAAKYVVKFNGEDHEVTNNYYDATGLTPSTQYTYQVKALAAANQDDYCDSEFSTEANFTTEVAPNATLTLMENGNEVDGGSHAILTPFALPTEVSHTCTKAFVGWDADPDCATAPTYAPGANFTFANTTGVTLYAVYAEAGDATYTKTAFADLASGDEVVITGDNGDMYALSSANGSSSAPTAVEVAEESANILNVTNKSDIFWIITKDGANFSFTVKGGTDKLYCTGENNGVRVGTNTNNVFSIKSDYIYNNGQSAYVGIYNSADWRRYSTINANITGQTFAFYKAVVAYSNYATTCVEALAKPTFNETAGTYNVVKSIELSADEGDIHYTTNGDDPDENSPVYSTAIALNDCGSTTIKAIAVDGARISEMAEATYVIKLPIAANTKDGAYTAAEAKAIIDEDCDLTSQQVYVKGTVQTPTYYSSSHTYTITLAGEEGFQFYKLYDLNGAEFTGDYIKAGDQLVAYGYLKKHNSTYELDQNCYLVSYEAYTEPKTDIDNTIDNPWTVAQADGFMDAPAQYDLEDVVFVKGVVTGFATNKVTIRDTENGTEYIELYKSTLADGISALIAGDLIIATGTLNKYNNTTYQMNQGCQVVWKKAKATIEIDDINMETGDELALSAISATITPDAAQSATITYEVTAGDAVSISEGKIIAEAAGEATITASIATTEDYIGASKEITVTVTAPDTRKKATASAFTALSGDMSSTDISFAAYQGDGTNPPVVRSGDNPVTIRLYKPASGKSTGAYLTLTAKVGCTIDQVKIEFSGNADAAYCKDAEALPTSKYITDKDELLTPTGLNAQSVSIVNLKSGSIDVAAITVWYNGDPLAVHHYILGGTYPTEFEQYGTFSYEGLTVTAAYNEQETITEPVVGFVVNADLSTAGAAKAEVYLGEDKLTEYDITVTPTAKSNPEIGWSPADNIVLTEGDEFTAPTWQNPHSVSVSFESTNTSVATVSNAGVITIKGLGSTTISATFDGDETYYSANPSITVTVNAAVEDLMGNWVVASSVAAGDRIIIANVAEGTAVKTLGAQNGNYRDEVASTVSNNIMTPADGTKVFTLIDASTIDANYTGFALRATNGNYLSAASSSSNNIKEVASVSDENAVWSIVISEGKAAIVAQGSYSRKVIRYNSSQPRFSCYAVSNDMKDVVIYKRAFDYERSVTAGKYGTICLPKAGKIQGATLFEIAYYDEGQRKIFFDEVENGVMVAGAPYIFQPNEGVDQIGVYYSSADVAQNAGHKNGLYGHYNLDYPAEGAEAARMYLTSGDYFLRNNEYWMVDQENRVYVDNYRAYIKLDKIGNDVQPQAYGRRRVTMSVNGEQVATGLENGGLINSENNVQKVLIDGRLFIIRGEKMYNANGQLVK